MGDFLRALPSAASSPLAFVAYLCLLLGWAFIALRNKRINSLLKSIEKLPEKDRKPTLVAEMGAVIPRSITAEQWLIAQKHQYIFFGYIGSVIAIVAVIAIIVSQPGVVSSPPTPEPSTAIAQSDIDVNPPVEPGVTAEVMSVTTTAGLIPTMTATTAPTRTPIVTPTPIDVSTPEGAMRAFLDSLQRGDTDLATSFISKYSIDFFEITPEAVSKSFAFAKDGLDFSYKVGEIQQIDDQTVRIPVTYSGKAIPFYDCCVLRKEDDRWHINLSTEDRSGDHSSLVDYRLLDNVYEQNNVTIRLLRVVRYSNKMEIKHRIENNNSTRYLLWGIWGDAQQSFTVYFGDQSKNIETEFKVPPTTNNNYTVTMEILPMSYPTSIVFRDLRLSEENDTTFPDNNIEPWSHRFELHYSP